MIAIDGKTIRRSFDRAAGRSPLHVVTAFAADARVTVGQVASGDKESEISAARTLLGLIAVNRHGNGTPIWSAPLRVDRIKLAF